MQLRRATHKGSDMMDVGPDAGSRSEYACYTRSVSGGLATATMVE